MILLLGIIHSSFDTSEISWSFDWLFYNIYQKKFLHCLGVELQDFLQLMLRDQSYLYHPDSILRSPWLILGDHPVLIWVSPCPWLPVALWWHLDFTMQAFSFCFIIAWLGAFHLLLNLQFSLAQIWFTEGHPTSSLHRHLWNAEYSKPSFEDDICLSYSRAAMLVCLV